MLTGELRMSAPYNSDNRKGVAYMKLGRILTESLCFCDIYTDFSVADLFESRVIIHGTIPYVFHVARRSDEG